MIDGDSRLSQRGAPLVGEPPREREALFFHRASRRIVKKERRTCLLCRNDLEAAEHKGKKQRQGSLLGSRLKGTNTSYLFALKGAGHPRNVYTSQHGSQTAYRSPMLPLFIVIKINFAPFQGFKGLTA
ncbi:uncharacterized protein LOC113464599 [Ceratina calcarata]|uniref:Uncharacterized protein LOC113464599 n=1 Tax=Ceratina calcarata TaxID=156304 RepID=A0AAJ7S505_9HYME|nr:uncharacterized protein LOC113464599 [Ceratina calcarata]